MIHEEKVDLKTLYFTHKRDEAWPIDVELAANRALALGKQPNRLCRLKLSKNAPLL